MITITLAPCLCADKPFAAVTTETVALVGADVPDGLQVALFDGSGTCLAVADVQDAQATLDLDTQEAVDATAPVGPGEAVSVWLVVGDKDTHIATVPCKLIRNLIDDESTHPHVPAERYPTVSELEKWLEAAGEVREGVCTCAKAAASSAEAAASSARLSSAQALDAVNAADNAQHYASDASDASVSAAKSYENAEASRKAAESAAQVAREARENAQLQQQQATAAAGNANGYRQQAANSQRLAERAQEKAEAAQEAAEEAQNAADGFASDAAQSAQERGAKAGEASQAAADACSANSSAQSAKTGAEAAQKAAEAAKAGAETAKASAEAKAQESATSATNAAGSAETAQEAAEAIEAEAARIGYGFLRPGSPLVIVGGDSTCFTLVKLVDDMVASHAPCLISRVQEGDYWFAMAAKKNAEKNAYHCYILNDNLAPEWEFWHPRGNGRILPYCVIVEGSAYIRTENTLDRFTLNDDGTGTLVKTLNLQLRGYYNGICQPQIAYNSKSGHILVADGAVYQVDHWDHYDLELNALGTSTAIGAGTWFTHNGWVYFVNAGTLYRALADDTLVKVTDADGGELLWNTADEGGSKKTWLAPVIFATNIYDGLHKFAISIGEDGEIVLGPRTAHEFLFNAGNAIFGCKASNNFPILSSTETVKSLISMTDTFASAPLGATFDGAHYGAHRDARPLLFRDTNGRTFDVFANGAVMQVYAGNMGG